MTLKLSWLKDHRDTAAPLDEVVDMLTRIGLDVDSVADPPPGSRASPSTG